MLDIVIPKVEVLNRTDNHGTLQLEPLEPGFGTTLGNALRRVLLSSLPGAAISSVRVDGIYHEFSDIPGVREDVTEIVLNVKQIRLRTEVDHLEPLRLDVNGSGRVTAGQIQTPPEVEIVNPDLYLFSVDNTEASTSLEFTVQKGKGYSPAEHREGMAIGVIPVDAIFTPIRKVNYTVEEMRIGLVNYERLLLDVWTDGTIEPEEAVAQSANILMHQLRILAEMGKKVSLPMSEAPTEDDSRTLPPGGNLPIEDLDLSVRAYNCLKRAGITRIGQVLDMVVDDLLAVRNFGRKSLEELVEHLEKRNLLEGSKLHASLNQGDAGIAAPAAATVEESAAVESEEAQAEPAVKREEPLVLVPTPAEEEEPDYLSLLIKQAAADEDEDSLAAEPEEPVEDLHSWEGVDWDDDDEDDKGYKKRQAKRRRAK